MLIVRGLQGLGDQFHQRPFLRAAAERDGTLYLYTPWPQLYVDLPRIRCMRWGTTLRTQQKNERRADLDGWCSSPRPGARDLRLTYGSKDLLTRSIYETIEAQLPLNGQPFICDAPNFGPLPAGIEPGGKPVALVRPVTARREWSATSRNCLPSYVNAAAAMLAGGGYHVVSVADVCPPAEVFVEKPPRAHQSFHGGELAVEQLMALMANVDLIVSPVGFTLPAALAYRTPIIVIGGGRGMHNAPWKVTDPRQDLSCVRWIMPDRYCMCDGPEHPCAKTITDFPARFERALASMSL